VYKATLRESGEEVAVKVQRPFVLETVSLDLHLVRQVGLFVRNFPDFSSRLDIVKILDEFAGKIEEVGLICVCHIKEVGLIYVCPLDEFAGNFYQEYNV
jgi:hypothetical protein